MPFGLTHAVKILRSRYDAAWARPLKNQNGLEAEVGLNLENKILHIEFSVELNEKRVTITAVYTSELPSGPIQTGQHLEQQNETSWYAHDPQVVAHLQRIKQDIEVPEFITL
jgi:hypothetical protein